MLPAFTPEQLFSAANFLALIGWLIIVVAPRWRWGAPLVAGAVIPGLLAVLYTAVVATQLPGAPGGFATLGDVATLFTNPWLLLAGWVHYLAFDLFIGSWEVRDAQRHGVPHVLIVPCLVLTFLLGPAGLLAYLTVRRVKSGSIVVASGGTVPFPSTSRHETARS